MTVYRNVREIRYPKWDPDKLRESQMSLAVLEHGKTKFFESVSIILLTKILSMISCKLAWPRFALFDVGPTRQFKSYTLNEAMKIVDEIFWLYLQSDFTMNSLERYKSIIENDVCLLVNDGTALFSSKARRTKDRLISGLSELIADGQYKYQERKHVFTLKGKVTLILNITSESFKNYKDRMLGLTFLEKVLTLHHNLSKQELDDWVEKQEKAKYITFKHKITPDNIETNIKEIPRHFLKLIKIRAHEFSYLSLRSFLGSQDVIKALIRANAALNNRDYVCSDDFHIVSLVKPYLVNPFIPNEGLVVKLRAQGLSYSQIMKQTGYKSNKQIQYILAKARIRGTIQRENNDET